MNTPAEQHSPTPILDLVTPLPTPDKEPINGRFAAPFLIAVGSIVMTDNLTTLAIPFGFLLVNFLSIAFHEFGHLVAGWCVGLRFKGVRIDPFRIRIDSGKWKFKVRPRLFRGFAHMSFDRVRRVRSRLIVCVFGGPTASLALGLTGIVGGEFGLARHYDSPWPTFLEFLGVWSFLIGCLSLIPFKARGAVNDAVILRALLFRKEEALPMMASYALSAVKNGTLLSPDYFMRWFRIASRPNHLQTNNYGANWLAYVAAPDEQTAALFLEKCLADSALLEDDQRDILIAEAAVFTAWRRNDTEKAEVWSKRIRSADRLNALSAMRVRIAMLCVHEDFDAATSELNRALALIREQPATAQRHKCDAEWTSWREQVLRRSPVAVVT